MSVNDGLGLLIGFAVVGGIILGELRSRKKQPIQPIKKAKRVKKRKIEDDLSLEDSQGDGLFFGDPLFPEDFDDLDDN